MDELLQVRNLRTYFFGGGRFTRAVNDVTIELRRGGRLGIVGQSGSGKSQTLMSIVGLVDGRPGVVSGETVFGGRNLYEGLDEFVQIRQSAAGLEVEKDEKGWARRLESNYEGIRGRRMGVIFQEPKSALVPYQTIEAQMSEAARAAHGHRRSFDRERALSIFESMRFDDPARILNSYPHEISGGESQRATIGIVLESNAELILADEPTSSLDPDSARGVLELLDEVVGAASKSLILVTHNAELLSGTVDHVAVMYAGMIVEHGPTGTILEEAGGASHPYTKRLVAAGIGWGDPTNVVEVGAGAAEIGCPYQLRCTLKNNLRQEVRSRCEHERPETTTISEGHWASCWGLGEEV